MAHMAMRFGTVGKFAEFSASYTVAGAQEHVLIPGGVGVVTFTIVPDGGTSKVQATTDPEDKIVNGTATWVDHPDGAVGTTLQDGLDPVSALRVFVVSGSAAFSVRAQ